MIWVIRITEIVEKTFARLKNFQGNALLSPPYFPVPQKGTIFFSQVLEFLVPLVSIVRDKHKSLRDHGSKIKPCSVSSAQSRPGSATTGPQGFPLTNQNIPRTEITSN